HTRFSRDWSSDVCSSDLNINTNRGLYRDYQPEIYDGDMVVFTAVGETETGPSATESWRPYVTGDIAEYRVDCIHADMLTVESVRSEERRVGEEWRGTRGR